MTEFLSALPEPLKKAIYNLFLAFMTYVIAFLAVKFGQNPPSEPVILQVEPGTMKIMKIEGEKEVSKKP